MGCCSGNGGPVTDRKDARRQFEGGAQDDPLAILKVRLAKGEIALEEYDRLRAVLNRSS